jgi:hypothetical protein
VTARKIEKWFRTFAMNVSQIYDAEEEMKIDLDKKEVAN